MITIDEIRKMKITQYEAIEVVKDTECPECHNSDVSGFSPCVAAKPIGWCETNSGFMAVFECPKCFTKFRCHINLTGRYTIESFLQDLYLIFRLFPKRSEQR